MDKISELEEKIEQVRLKMYKFYSENPTDQRVLEVSTELDHLLNRLNEATKVKR
ncbi:aspartyl-phosphate phosphatase Spo0E family protein [Halobacillus sp. Marseille-Q1614]|uniref:aspartyl-phosphate phosphatase Spo0E family protein n=1 Tax=Halobacillus sp. Marseille-Q1614 TaxID=2709134 RepID=UPI00156E323D|nr:aspartyl-phosphate phosphatase Spo0E family protein [Halobacillus sp. Marseille-Q1614]